jgi:hypothetical protein
MSKALASQGLDTESWDIADNPLLDLTNPDILRRIFDKLRSGRVKFLWLGTPCQSFSRARKNDGLGPGPLRSDDLPEGLPGLSKADAAQVRLGNRLLEVSIQIMELAFDHNIPFVLENPLSSRMWLMPSLRRFISKTGARFNQVDYCQYGTDWRKPTGLLHWRTNNLEHVLKVCQPHRGVCSCSGRLHVRLVGRDATGTFWTLRAQPYPILFCRSIAHHVVAAIT